MKVSDVWQPGRCFDAYYSIFKRKFLTVGLLARASMFKVEALRFRLERT